MSFTETIKNMFGSSHQYMGIIDEVKSFLNDNGGVEGLKLKFEKEGLGNIFQSWVGSGKNLPISPEQIQKVMGTQFIQNIAQKLGVDPTQAAQKITEMLPKVVDTLTPEGRVASEDPSLTQH